MALRTAKYATPEAIEALAATNIGLARQKKQLLAALQLCYRKHVQGVDDIGWDELGETMHDTLADVMGDDAYCAWLATADKGE